MEKIKLNSEKELELITCGINVDNEKITLKILPGEDTLDTLNTLLSNKEETSTLTLLSESGNTLGIYNGYTRLQQISLEPNAVVGYENETQDPIMGNLVTIVLYKVSDTEERLASVESQITDTQMALCEIYEKLS